MFGPRKNRLFKPTRTGVSVRHPSGLDIELRPLTKRDAAIHAEHLKRLPPEDRRTRFFLAMNDAAITSYSDHIDWKAAFVVGAFIDGTLRGVGELSEPNAQGEAEIALTVEPAYRHAAIGRILLAAMLVAAEAEGVTTARLLFLRENDAMRRLAGDIGARLSSASGVTEALVPLPPA